MSGQDHDRDAVQAFGSFVGPDRKLHEKLLQEIVDGVKQVAASGGLAASVNKEGDLAISHGYRPGVGPAVVSVVVTSHGEGPCIMLFEWGANRQQQMFDVPLRFDHAAQRVTGVEHDTSIAPTPGEPIPYRSAIAVVAEMVVERLRAQLGK